MSKKKHDSTKQNGAGGKAAETPTVELQIEHHVIPAAQFANHLVVQADVDSVFLSFFQLSPPFLQLSGSDEEKLEMLRKSGKLVAEGVARVVIPRSKIGVVVEAIQKTVTAIDSGKKIEIKGK